MGPWNFPKWDPRFFLSGTNREKSAPPSRAESRAVGRKIGSALAGGIERWGQKIGSALTGGITRWGQKNRLRPDGRSSTPEASLALPRCERNRILGEKNRLRPDGRISRPEASIACHDRCVPKITLQEGPLWPIHTKWYILTWLPWLAGPIGRFWA